MKYIIIVFTVVYIYRLFVHSFRFYETLSMISFYEDQIKSLKKINNERIVEEYDFYPLIEKNPKFNNLSDWIYWRSEIDYRVGVDNLTEGTLQNHTELKKLKDNLKFKFRGVLNPLNTVIYLLQLPGKLLKSMGFNLNKKSQTIISILVYLMTYFLAMFQSEIKQLITTLFQ